mmetsp:Transcript_21552/g.37882  ORF Transcript_21552/g.37882 Transcript_21552/m.37882 type:complete len:445 (+) Transcript_21552:248-1582(+)|eukprot:CAMPEP_0178753104 /NCGR_PEP_ID=MMETSP0744-20121128/11430_1 /TAXON_ID=913974 /ORGANISM="Nitzschia punctata, Strain CCMP561" /LENGTH=444 /DNA_ID=CAMNT_0020406891 /DNA_START=129 /DNA_END=1463 /DNA_ORIENTATION=-
MSLSAYDIFMRLDGFDEESSSASSASEVEENENDHDHDHDMGLSSVGSESFVSMNDAISLDSAILQELASSIRPESSEDGERTILSSAPSGATIPAPEASQDVFALTPHPRFVSDGIQSLSTTNTECLPFEHFCEKDTSEDDSSSFASLLSSLSRNSSALVARRAHQEGHDAAVFERIASQLMNDGSISPLSGSPVHWYNRLVSESDWDQFRVAAKAILSILEPKPAPSLMPLPPLPPTQLALPSSGNTRQVSYFAQEHLPSDFICGLCKDVIVGACTLDCGCNSSMVCASCWENEVLESPHDMSDQMGFVWIEDSCRECPSCHANVNAKVHCHALDVAILHIIRDMPEMDEKLECLKQNYYSRLAAWRSTVYERNETRTKQIAAHRDELLARLIQEEEEIFWNPQENSGLSSKSNGILFLGQAAVALVAATVASIGLNAFSKR